MKERRLASRAVFAILAAIFWVSAAPATAEVATIRASELVPGEPGHGLTVLMGDSIIRFPLKYVGRVERALAARDLVLIRLEGPPFETTGVIAGMSGSPVYFRGRLLGALAYAWAFSKEPIAGVTPIEDMLRVVEEQETIPADGAWMPLHAPLSVAGLGAAREGETWRRIGELGFLAVPGGRRAGRAAPLEPGSPVGVKLIDGDLSITAVGTVTWTGDSNVLAFGHPFLNRGRTRLPMCGARIDAVLPSDRVSTKLGSALDDLGTLLRDGNPGIAGRLGAVPPMIPMTVEVATPWSRDRYEYRIARDELLTPALIDIAWSASAEAGLFTAGQAGVEIRVEVGALGRLIALRDRGVVSQSVLEVMPTLPLRMLFSNAFERFMPERVSVRVEVDRDVRHAQILRVVPARSVVKPGESLPVDVVLRVYGEGERRVRLDLPVPVSCPEGRLEVRVGGGRGFTLPERARPTSLEELFTRLGQYEPSDRLVARLLPAGGRLTEIEGGILPELPPGLRRVQAGAERGGEGMVTRLMMEYPVEGEVGASVEVKK